MSHPRSSSAVELDSDEQDQEALEGRGCGPHPALKHTAGNPPMVSEVARCSKFDAPLAKTRLVTA